MTAPRAIPAVSLRPQLQLRAAGWISADKRPGLAPAERGSGARHTNLVDALPLSVADDRLTQVIMTMEAAGVDQGRAGAVFNGLTLVVFSRYTYSR